MQETIQPLGPTLQQPPPRSRRGRGKAGGVSFGHAQISLVEHALCPLDITSSLSGPLLHETTYAYSDKNRHRKDAHVRVICPDGLSPIDEFYLWGLLSLTFSQPDPTVDFYATPYYCMRRLGCIDAKGRRGSADYQRFRSALERLSSVTYKSDAFFDPIRGEHRDVSFGFLSYSLPVDPKSARTWRIAWDPIFFEFCSAVRGALLFDFQTYRDLDFASRRLYLLLRKIFWRNAETPEFDLHELCVHTIGFSANHDAPQLKRKLLTTAGRLLTLGVIAVPPDASDLRDTFVKYGRGKYAIRFLRGPHFDSSSQDARPADVTESPAYEQLVKIGLDRPLIRRVIEDYDARLVHEIADMTLAAKEKFGDAFFKNSPQAYFMDNLREFAKGKRTPPDWWRDVRKREEETRRQSIPEPGSFDERTEATFKGFLESQPRAAIQEIFERVFQNFRHAGKTEDEARTVAMNLTELHFRNRFFRQHPEARKDTPQRLSDLLHL
jgi:hypothetical protein